MQTKQDCIKYVTPEHGHMFAHMQLVLGQSKCVCVKNPTQDPVSSSMLSLSHTTKPNPLPVSPSNQDMCSTCSKSSAQSIPSLICTSLSPCHSRPIKVKTIPLLMQSLTSPPKISPQTHFSKPSFRKSFPAQHKIDLNMPSKLKSNPPAFNSKGKYMPMALTTGNRPCQWP